MTKRDHQQKVSGADPVARPAVDVSAEMSRLFSAAVTPQNGDTCRVGFKAYQAKALATEILSRFYDVGLLVDVRENTLGYVNAGFEITVISPSGAEKKFFLKRANDARTPTAIAHEHQVIGVLNAKDPTLTATLVKTKLGETLADNLAGQEFPGLYSLSTYLDGEDRHSWITPPSSIRKNQAGGLMLARYHSAVAGEQFSRVAIDPPLKDLWPRIVNSMEQPDLFFNCQTARDVFEKAKDCLLGVAHRVGNMFGIEDLSGCPELEIHSDFHPGNVRWEDKKITCVFDFDWSRRDLRIVDVALAVSYFAKDKIHKIGKPDVVPFDILKAEHFLAAYNHHLKSEGQNVPPISAQEQRLLPIFIEAGNLFVLDWVMGEIVRKSDPNEVNKYVAFMRYQIDTARWLADDANRLALSNALGEALENESSVLSKNRRAMWRAS